MHGFVGMRHQMTFRWRRISRFLDKTGEQILGAFGPGITVNPSPMAFSRSSLFSKSQGPLHFRVPSINPPKQDVLDTISSSHTAR